MSGYVIVGALWVACTAWLLAMGFTGEIAPAAIGGLLIACTAAAPVAFVAACTWRSARALIGTARRHQAYRPRGGR